MALHLVLGATRGFGAATTRALLARGESVRAMVLDPSRARLPAGVEVVAGNALHPVDLMDASDGCVSIVHGVRLAFHAWDPDLVRITAHVAQAAQYRRAAVVMPANAWGLKLIYDVPLPPRPPRIDFNDPRTRKGALLNQLEDILEAQALEDEGVSAIIVRAGDCFGPGVDNTLTGTTFRNALAGKSIPWFGNKPAQHPWTYMEDVGRVAADVLLQTLARGPAPARPPNKPEFVEIAAGNEHWPDEVMEGQNVERLSPRVTHVNIAPTITTDSSGWAALLARHAGHPKLGVSHYPDWVVRAAGKLRRDAGEMAELRWHWHAPILLDDADTRKRLPHYTPTTPDDAIQRTLAWFRAAA